MSKWDDLTEREVDKHGVDCTLIRLADPDVPGSTNTQVTLKIANLQYRERDVPSGGDVTQTKNYWIVPAKRLVATGYPVPPRAGDRMIFPHNNHVATVRNVGEGFAGGQVIRYDLETLGL